VYCPQCSAKCADTDLVTELAKAIRAAWVDRLDWDELAQGALEFLTSTGRLIPAGGMALTAEQAEDVRIVTTAEVGGYTGEQFRRWHAAKDRLVESLFPATEPAEVETKAELCAGGGGMHPCVLPASHSGVHADSRGLRWNNPASSPVVPATTETSEIRAAADALSSALVILDPLETGHWEHAWRTLNDLDDCAKREKASATAEAGGWDTWDTVPENVTVVSSFLDHRYRKVDGEVFRVLEDGKQHKAADFTPTDMRSFAPFVAAEEG
jgi:hypothetical protein